jgi:colanic acid/amylovoran biosynthesis glycosyltransferase
LTGYLVLERNVEELTDRLLKLIEHPEDWIRMGHAGRAHVNRHFDARRLAVELSEIYEQIVG